MSENFQHIFKKLENTYHNFFQKCENAKNICNEEYGPFPAFCCYIVNKHTVGKVTYDIRNFSVVYLHIIVNYVKVLLGKVLQIKRRC